MVKPNTNPKVKIRGTVQLLKQSLQLMVVMVVAGLVVASSFDFPIGLIITGVAISAIGGSIIGFRHLIWDSYNEEYAKKSIKYYKFLFSPSIWSYRINVFIIWPLSILLGIALVIAGAFSRL